MSQPWTWPESEWRGYVNKVRAGQPLKAAWPDNNKIAVALSFDSDHETIPLRDGETSPGRMAAGEYGARVGIGRILNLLEKYAAPASFYLPAVCALLRPDESKTYVAAGHEVGIHGWIHERNSLLDYATERELMLRAAEVLEKTSGVRPVGIRTPSWDYSPYTLQIIREMGLIYDSSLMADDEPYELIEEGVATGVVEIPVEWIRDDAPYFTMDRFNSIRPHTKPRDVLEIWVDEFNQAYKEGGVFQLTMHPHVIGHRSRMVILDELMQHITAHAGVWFTTHAGLANHVGRQLKNNN